jgi:ATP-binding cassette subfamily B (MDR/TAP) protein 1
LLMLLGTVGAIGDGMSTNCLLVFASRIMNSLGYGQTRQDNYNFMVEVQKVSDLPVNIFISLSLCRQLNTDFLFCFCQQCSLDFVYLGLAVMVMAFMGNLNSTNLIYTHDYAFLSQDN